MEQAISFIDLVCGPCFVMYLKMNRGVSSKVFRLAMLGPAARIFPSRHGRKNIWCRRGAGFYLPMPLPDRLKTRPTMNSKSFQNYEAYSFSKRISSNWPGAKNEAPTLYLEAEAMTDSPAGLAASFSI